MSSKIKEMFPIISKQAAQQALEIKRRNKKGWEYFGVSRPIGKYIEGLATGQIKRAKDVAIPYAYMLSQRLTKENARKLRQFKNKGNYTWTFLNIGPNTQRKINHILNG